MNAKPFVAGAVFLLACCRSSSTTSTGIAYSLLADSRLIAVGIQDGRISAESILTRDSPLRMAGQLMVLRKSANSMTVLVANRLFVVELPQLRISRTFPLTPTNCVFRSLAIGSTSSRLYAFGNCPNAIVVTVLDPDATTQLKNWSVRMPARFDWQIYQGNVSADERRIYISYHGSNTTGIDWFNLTADGLERCQTDELSNMGCIRVHGGFDVRGDRVFATSSNRLIVETDTNGNLLKAYDTYIENNHVMGFVVNYQGTRLYAVGSCGYQDAFSAVDLVNGGVPVSSSSGPPQLLSSAPLPIYKTKGCCGERMALSQDQILVVAQTERTTPDPNNRGTLVVIDVKSGGLLRSVITPSEPVDVITDR